MLKNIFNKINYIFNSHDSTPSHHTVYIELTDKCNMSCPMCMTKGYRKSSNERLLTRDQIGELIFKPAKLLGFKTVMLTGGEPTLRPDILGIIEDSVSLGFQVYFATNLLKYNHDLFKNICLMLKNGKHGIQVSFDSLHEDEMNKIRGKNIYSTILDNSKKLIKLHRECSAECSLCANITIQQENSESIIKTIRFLLNEVGFKYVSLQPRHDYSFITPQNFNKQSVPDYVIQNKATFMKLIDHLFDMAQQDKRIYIHGGTKENWIDFFSGNLAINKSCRSKEMIFVDCYGNLRGCISSSNICSIKDQSLKKYLQSKEYKKFLNFVKICKICVHGCS